MKKSKKFIKGPRQKARELAVQAIYQWQLSHASIDALSLDFIQSHNFEKVDKSYWHELVNEGIKLNEAMQNAMQPFLSRSVSSITPVEMAILKVAFYELIYRSDVPFRVVINEAIDLAKCFGASDSHRFINGVLDAAAKKIRSTEVKMPK